MNAAQESFYQGRSVWVIGASSGIGRALAKELCVRGASVVASARNTEALQELSEEAGGHIKPLPLDVSSADELANGIRALEGDGAFPDSIIFVAGFYEPTAIEHIAAEDLVRTLQVNLWSVIELVRLSLPVLYGRGHGQIAIVGSVAGYRGLPKGQPYSATKAALINFTETLYLEAKPRGIDVKLISPGFVETPMTDKNSFTMPDIISSIDAALHIANELPSKRFEIHFPKRFTRKLKFLASLPYALYLRIASKL